MENKKPVIGILGAPGSGKSSVAAEFEKLGCAVIDADKIAHKLLENNDIKQKIRDCFGLGVFDENEDIDRAKLGDIVFENEENVKKINDIIHGQVLIKCSQLLAEYHSNRDVMAIVLDMPLLLEVGWKSRCDKLIFVDTAPQIRAERAGKQQKLNKKQLKKREFFQISLDKKAQTAHYIIQNNSDLPALSGQVVRIFSTMFK